MSGPGKDDLVWFQPPPSEGWTEDQVKAFNERLNMEMMSFSSTFCLNLSISARLYYMLEADDVPGTPQGRFQDIHERALDVTVDVLNLDPVEAALMATQLRDEAKAAISAEKAPNYDVYQMATAMVEAAKAARAWPENPFEDEDDEEDDDD